MFLLLNIFEGIDDIYLSNYLESTNRCQRVHHRMEYRNNYDIYSASIKFPIVFDIIKNNADFCNKHISLAHIINVPCRPDIIWNHYKTKYKEYASSAYFNRSRRMYEISKYKNCLTIPYELFYKNISYVQNFMGIGKEFPKSDMVFERTNFSLNWKYESQLKKMKKQISWFENFQNTI